MGGEYYHWCRLRTNINITQEHRDAYAAALTQRWVFFKRVCAAYTTESQVIDTLCSAIWKTTTSVHAHTVTVKWMYLFASVYMTQCTATTKYFQRH